MRRKIEEAFGITDEQAVKTIIDQQKKIANSLGADWYIAQLGGLSVGSIGLAEFTKSGCTFGRLLDVDILPEFQGNGLGTRLIQSAISKARRKELTGLCLRAEKGSWENEWYAQHGFIEIDFNPSNIG